jgi:dTMP kinase
MVQKNFFLVIEGLDGSGKSVITRKLVNILRHELGDRVNLTFEPHDPSCSGLFIRQVLMKKISVNPNTLALAFAANRSDHVEREIEDFLRKDHSVVVCDRYYLSSLVYQSTETLSMERVFQLNASIRKPDLTLFLNAETQTCYKRMRRRPEEKELFETNLDVTRQKYKDAIEFLRARGERIIEIDANGEIDQTLNIIFSSLSDVGIPDWLPIQIPLNFSDNDPDVITINGENSFSHHSLVEKILRTWEPVIPSKPDALLNQLNELENIVSNEMDQISLNDVCILFKEFLSDIGYIFVAKYPWTDIIAYQLEYSLPLGLVQYGSLLFLGGIQGYSHITRKIFELGKFADFMFVMDPRKHAEVEYYDRDILRGDGTTPSPTNKVFNRQDVKNIILMKCIKEYVKEHLYGISFIHDVIRNFILNRKLEEIWRVIK